MFPLTISLSKHPNCSSSLIFEYETREKKANIQLLSLTFLDFDIFDILSEVPFEFYN